MDDFDDIPVALRDTPAHKPPLLRRRRFWSAGLAAGGVGLLAGAIAATLPNGLLQGFVSSTLAQFRPGSSASDARTTGAAQASASRNPDQSKAGQTQPGPNLSNPSEKPGSAKDPSTKNPSTKKTSAKAAGPKDPPKAILGHFPYAEAKPETLNEVAPGIQLSKAAATAYQALEKAARADGISLVPLSGFRSQEDQKYLFFGVKGERGQTASERAKVSAPPGYSEHHTGYALDIGDAAATNSNLSESFEQTQAFKWLEKNAAYHSFELSFPKGNAQGVNYEPWHWRYVGDQHSLETFHQSPTQP
jgi:zinc D-Ala-D-Ala carboxypeptidase